jgi:fatty acid desaturase
MTRLDSRLAQELHRVEYWRHAVRIGLFVCLYGLGAAGAVTLVGMFGSWLWALPAYGLAAASLHGISLFAHEAVHGTLAPNPLWNRVLGAACALPVLQNCSAIECSTCVIIAIWEKTATPITTPTIPLEAG